MPQFASQPISRVNSTTAGEQTTSAVVSLSGGGYVVVWSSTGVLSNGLVSREIYAQQYDASGATLGGEVLVHQSPPSAPGSTGEPLYGAVLGGVAGLTDGGYVVTWTERLPEENAQGVATSVQAQLLDAASNLMGAPEQANTVESWVEPVALPTALADGGYLVTWQRVQPPGTPLLFAQIYTQRFDAAGQPVGDDSLVTGSGEPGSLPSVTPLDDGGWAVAWSSFSNYFEGADIYTEQFSSSGEVVRPTIRVDPSQAFETQPDAATLANGNYVVVWQTTAGSAAEPAVLGAQLFDPAGQLLGAEVEFETAGSTSEASQRLFPQVTALSDGGFLLSWQHTLGSGGVAEILAQYFDANAQAKGATLTLQAPHDVAQQQAHWSVTATPDGGFVVSTELQNPLNPQTGLDIYTEKLTPIGPAEPEGKTLTGGNGKDLLTGTLGDDALQGDNGKDVLVGGGGDDLLDGGNGVDVAVYLGALAQYTVMRTPEGYSVTDNTGDEGLDILTHVERLLFADQAVALNADGPTPMSVADLELPADLQISLMGLAPVEDAGTAHLGF